MFMYPKRPRIFITGGAGYIGGHLAVALAPFAELTVYDALVPRVHAAQPALAETPLRVGARLVEGDIRDGTALAEALRAANPQIVIHLAAETGTADSHGSPAHHADVNITGTARLIEAMRAAAPDLRRVILASSRAVYGEGAYTDASGRPAQATPRRAEALARGEFLVTDHHGNPLRPAASSAACPPAPVSVYGSSKLMQEYLLRQALWGSGVELGVLRLQNVYGTGQAHGTGAGILSLLAARAAGGAELPLFEDGLIQRDFIHVSDVAEAFRAAALAPHLPAMPLDIGTGRAVTLRLAARSLKALAGGANPAIRITGESRPGDIRHACADPEAARRALDWQPSVALEEGLRQVMGHHGPTADAA